MKHSHTSELLAALACLALFTTALAVPITTTSASSHRIVRRIERESEEPKPAGYPSDPGANNAYDFIPRYMGSPRPSQPAVTWTGDCFESMSAEWSTTPVKNGLSLTITVGKKKNLFCSDMYLLTTPQRFKTARYFSEGTKSIVFDNLSGEELLFVQEQGVQVFLVSDKVLGSLRDLWDTLWLFVGPRTRENNIAFLKDKMNMTLQERTHQDPIILDPSLIKSGDILAIRPLDTNVDPLIMWGTGSHTGHTAVTLWIDNELYICESKGKSPGGKWPPPYGWIKTPYKQWLKQAEVSGYDVVLLPLAPELSKQFNTTAAVEWQQWGEGYPYGYSNFVFGWIDTPNDNFPPPLSSWQFLQVGILIASKIAPAVASQLWEQALNHRLGTVNLTSAEIVDTLLKRNQTLGELITVPEEDNWTYTGKDYDPKGGSGPSCVCDVFALSMLRAAGVFGDLADKIRLTEQTPRDCYMMQIYDQNYTKPEPCNVDPDIPYCQILGQYTLHLPGVNTIKLYPNMNEKCPSLPTQYVRPEGC